MPAGVSAARLRRKVVPGVRTGSDSAGDAAGRGRPSVCGVKKRMLDPSSREASESAGVTAMGAGAADASPLDVGGVAGVGERERERERARPPSPRKDESCEV